MTPTPSGVTTAMKDLGICLVGCGMIARFHIRALADVPGTRVAALVDTVPGAPERLIEQAKLDPVPTYSDVAAAVKQKDVDIVIVCTPSGAHMEPAVTAADAGKHVVVERPLEVTVERCDAVINACTKSGAKLCTIFPSRFADGGLGVIQAATSIHPGYPKTIAIHGDRGSAVVEQDDVLRWDFNPPTPQDEEIKKRFAQKVGASGGSSDPAAISHVGHAKQLGDFVAAIRENRAPLVDGREGRKAVATICAIYESARTGKVVEMAGR